MTKLAAALSMCFLFLPTPVSVSMPENKSSVESEIIALENAWSKAELHNDAGALTKLMADDVVLTEPDGSIINKTEELAFTSDPDAHFEIQESRDMKVYAHGDTAIVIGAYHEKGTFRGSPFEHTGRFTDTWIRRNAGWQCAASHFSISVPD